MYRGYIYGHGLTTYPQRGALVLIQNMAQNTLDEKEKKTPFPPKAMAIIDGILATGGKKSLFQQESSSTEVMLPLPCFPYQWLCSSAHSIGVYIGAFASQ